MIKLRADYSKKLSCPYSIFVSFPYNPLCVQIMRSMGQRVWIAENKEWEIGQDCYQSLLEALKCNNLNYDESYLRKSIDELKIRVEKNKAIQTSEQYIDTSILKDVTFKTTPRDYQLEGIAYGLEHNKFLLADEQGCIDEDSIIQVNINGNSRKITIKQAAKIFKSKNYKSFKVRCLKETYFGIHDVEDILYTGNKDCYKIILEDGKELIATPDHEILTNNGFKPLIKLEKTTDLVYTNGKYKCPICGCEDNIITYPYAKFFGYCKKCMYQKLREDCKSNYTRKLIKGYWFITGKKVKGHHLTTPNGVPEHQLLAEQKYGKKLDLRNEVVHHLDGNPKNNSLENLVILTKQEHNKLHSKEKYKHLFQKNYTKKTGAQIIVVPKLQKIREIIHIGNRNVYDIKMKDPYHNFVANGIVIHNCGKTLQCANIASLKRGGKHCLVIVGYDVLQFNWVAEITKHTNEQAHVLGQQEYKSGSKKGKLRKGTMEDRINDLLNIDNIEPFFIITSIATLRHCEKQKYIDKNGKERVNKIFVVANIIEDLCKKGIIGRVILDESQVCKNMTSQQTEALLKIRSCPYKIAATGTPLMNKHADLYPLMYWLNQTQQSYWDFRDEYCIMGGFKNKQIIGNKNGPKLNESLSKFMLRRRKDILNLPDKIIIDEILEMDGKQEVYYNKIKSLVKQDMIKMKGNKVALLASLIKLRQITCHPGWLDDKYKDSAKFERVHQLMYEITENEQKAIIFSNWSTPIEWLYDELKIYNPAMITGDTKDRMSEINKFQDDPSCKVILGTIGAMGTGVTLTAASNVIFLDEPWNRALKDQCTDRAHRIGTKSNVNVYTLICKDSIDEKVHNTVYKKGLIQDEVVDGISIEDIEEILN